MIDFILSKTQKELLKKSEDSNTDEMLSWKLPNLIFPIAVIVISMVCFLMFKDEQLISCYTFFNLLLNGSLPMVALNRLSGLGINLLKTEKEKTKVNIYNLRVIIQYYALGLIACIFMLYIYQVIKTPFDIWWSMILQIFIAALCIHQSLRLSKYGYLLQEKLLERTLGDDIRENSNEQKKHLSKKYGE